MGSTKSEVVEARQYTRDELKKRDRRILALTARVALLESYLLDWTNKVGTAAAKRKVKL